MIHALKLRDYQARIWHCECATAEREMRELVMSNPPLVFVVKFLRMELNLENVVA